MSDIYFTIKDKTEKWEEEKHVEKGSVSLSIYIGWIKCIFMCSFSTMDFEHVVAVFLKFMGWAILLWHSHGCEQLRSNTVWCSYKMSSFFTANLWYFALDVSELAVLVAPSALGPRCTMAQALKVGICHAMINQDILVSVSQATNGAGAFQAAPRFPKKRN